MVSLTLRTIDLASQWIRETKASPDAKIDRTDATIYFSPEIGRNRWLMVLDVPIPLKVHLELLDSTMNNNLRQSELNGLSTKLNITLRYKNFEWQKEKELADESRVIKYLPYFLDGVKTASFVDRGNDRYEIVIQPADAKEILVISLVKPSVSEPISNAYVPVVR